MSAHVEQSGFVGRVLGDRWIVGEQLGSGSFGVVHAGVERATGAAVAVKLLHPQFIHHHETIARFWNEAEALRRLNHPNVLVLIDAGVCDDGVPYLVTELLTGETLKDLLRREGALPAERAMRLLGPAAHALHHAHLAGILHRDLKPENIFRLRRDGLGTTKILDFGMAKLLDTPPGKKLSQTGVLIGTMAYSAPEQMQGVTDLDARADQFGFAALMFEALTGQRPFPQSQPFALFQAVMTGARPRASELRPGIPAAVDEVLLRGLDVDRNRRYASVEDFYLALTQAFAGATFEPAALAAPIAPAASAPPPAPPASPANVAQFGPPVRQYPAATTMASVPAPSARYRAVEEEATRVPVAAPELGPPSDAPAPNPLNTTLASARPPARAPASRTLMEGTAPPNDFAAGTGFSTPMPIMSPLVQSAPPPPVSAVQPAGASAFEAPASAPPPPLRVVPSVSPPATAVVSARSNALWLVLLVVAVLVVAAVAFLMGRASNG